MIQRIQSIFLLLASGSCLGLLGMPLATTAEAQADSSLFMDSSYNLWDSYALISIFVAAGVIFLATIFFFGNRKLQIRLTQAAFFMVLAGIGVGTYLFFQDSAQEAARSGIGLTLPVLGILFGFLSYRFIKKDEKLVRSMDRLR